MIEPRCADCANWDSKNGLTGFCEELTECLKLTEFDPSGLMPCQMVASGRCKLFEPPEEAVGEARDEVAHMNDLRREAGPCRRAA